MQNDEPTLKTGEGKCVAPLRLYYSFYLNRGFTNASLLP